MKILILSDIHANNFALEKVMEDANTYHSGYEAVWFLGDLVGWGANPVEAYDLVKQACTHNGQHHIWLSGNHEETIKKLEMDQTSLAKTQKIDKRHLEELFLKFVEAKDHFENITKKENKKKELSICDWKFYFSHISYHEPNNEDRYLYSWFEHDDYVRMFKEEFEALPGHGMENRCLLYGHTHVPTLVKIQQNDDCSLVADAIKIFPFVPYPLEHGCTWIINPGSVGIPNDLDARASYAILEIDEGAAKNSSCDNTITFCRVAYETEDAFRAMAEKGYSFIDHRQNYMTRLIGAKPVINTPTAWVEHYKTASQKQRKDQGD